MNVIALSSSQRDEIEKYETELIEKDNMLEQCHKKIEEMDGKLKRLEAENRILLTQKSQEELERIQMKKQSMKLDLKCTTSSTDVQTDTMGLALTTSTASAATSNCQTSGTETCDTFHTANSDCSFASALPSPFPPKGEHQQQQQQQQSPTSELPEDGQTVMSDSGVCLDTKPAVPQASSTAASLNAAPHVVKTIYDGGDSESCSSQNFYEQLLQSQMEKLREKVAAKKAEIMKLLEMGGEKSTLDKMINELQELQMDFVKMEMRLESSRGKKKSKSEKQDEGK